MSAHLTSLQEARAMSSAELAAAITAADRSQCAATVVGYGNMGGRYVAALRALGLRQIRVCARSTTSLQELQGVEGVELVSGGYKQLTAPRQLDELAIIAAPTDTLAAAAEHVASIGFRRLLIEKPVSLWSGEIEQLAKTLERHGVDAACAYNRLAYPSFHEASTRAVREGGITSCTYTFTEMIATDWPDRFPPEELARWGIANSLHVIAMAHGLIGLPAMWTGYRNGELSWHPAGAVFVGSGKSGRGIPFAYHADWGSTGRWSVELHTAVASYRLCPLERLSRRLSAMADWVEVPVQVFAPQVKAGLAEQVAAMLHPAIRQATPLVSLQEAVALTRYAEEVFGYEGARGGRAHGEGGESTGAAQCQMR